MPIGTVTKRFDNEKNIKVTFDNDRDKAYSTNKRELYPILQEGHTVDYSLVQNGQYTNIVGAIVVEGAPEPAANGSRDNRNQTQIMLENASGQVVRPAYKDWLGLDPKTRQPFIEYLKEIAIGATWYLENVYVTLGYYPKLVRAAIEEGGQIVEVDSPLADILNNPPQRTLLEVDLNSREAGDV